jgi:NAD(P)-dependent dehydrogenase (short-subunit alcohol dehydrogenase family)
MSGSQSLSWRAADIPAQRGRIAVITGGSGGIGLAAARRLAARGAHVVLAGRDLTRGTRAAVEIGQQTPGASTEVCVLDLGDLASVRRFAAAFSARHGALDILVNNAGIAGGPRRETADGFEAHFGVNHLGHFALTGLLLPALLARPGARVVTMSSGLAAQARIDFSDPHGTRGYRMTTAYGQSKLANLLFAVELDRRLRHAFPGAAAGGLSSLAAHPGVARTALMTGKRAEWGRGPGPAERAVRMVQLAFGASPDAAAWPALYQATSPQASGGTYVGTSGHMRGGPASCAFPPAALDATAAERLWRLSEKLTGVSYMMSGAAGTGSHKHTPLPQASSGRTCPAAHRA